MGKTATIMLGLALGALVGGRAAAVDNVVIHGKVVHRGSPVTGALVSVLGLIAATGPDGAFRIKGVPALHDIAFRYFERAKDGAWEFRDGTARVPFLVVSAYAEMGKGGILGYFGRKVERGGIRQIASGDAGRALTLELSEIGDWDAYCRKCHPTSPVLDEKAVIRPAKEDAQKPAVTAEFFSVHRHRDSHPSGFDYAAAAARRPRETKYAAEVEGLPLRDGGKVDCGTCHTFHLAGAVPAYAREEFAESNRLCERCHR
jgi:hypothetical protein